MLGLTVPSPGCLFVVATPLGHLQDITLRALSVLREVSLIACEDTRHTRTLLGAHGIGTPTTSYFEHNERWKGERILEALRSGKDVALVSDAGTPGISDPGFRLVREARAEGIPVLPIPGPSAAVTALSVSGLPTARFLFVGFLPSKAAARRRSLEELAGVRETLVFYESPLRLRDQALRGVPPRSVVRPARAARRSRPGQGRDRAGGGGSRRLRSRHRRDARGSLPAPNPGGTNSPGGGQGDRSTHRPAGPRGVPKAAGGGLARGPRPLVGHPPGPALWGGRAGALSRSEARMSSIEYVRGAPTPRSAIRSYLRAPPLRAALPRAPFIAVARAQDREPCPRHCGDLRGFGARDVGPHLGKPRTAPRSGIHSRAAAGGLGGATEAPPSSIQLLRLDLARQAQ